MIPCQTYILCIRSECIHILIPKQASQWSRWFLPQGLCTSSPSFPRLTTSYWSMPISNTSSPETSVPCSLLLPHALQPWPSSNLWLEQIRKVSVKPSVKWKQKKMLILYFSLGFFYAFVPYILNSTYRELVDPFECIILFIFSSHFSKPLNSLMIIYRASTS
jgi:hypothetical protein